MLQPPPGLHLPEAEPAEEAPPSGPGIPQLVADDDINVEEDFLRLTTGSTLVTGGQPEPEVTPAPSTSQPIASSKAPNTEEATALTQAMRRKSGSARWTFLQEATYLQQFSSTTT